MTSPPGSEGGGRGRLKGRIAVVTGSSSGLGQAICLAFAAEGASIFCIDLYPSPRNAVNAITSRADDFHNRMPSSPGTHELIRQQGGEATYHKADVTRARDVELAIRACVQRYKRVDIMVNNAGVSVESTHIRPLRCHETSEEDFDKTLAINTKGMFLGCKYALKQMLEQGQMTPDLPVHGKDKDNDKSSSRGWIINTASVQGLVPYYGTPSYCASKGAAVMLTKQIALDYAKDLVHCNALCPGFLDTSMTQNLQSQEDVLQEIRGKHPLGEKLGNVEDVARAAVFLASDDAAWVTGVPLPVDGGYLLR
jgi:NAD(P)-dependent dehydrogenase (short-subunit alcohol dehydrogenase family)